MMKRIEHILTSRQNPGLVATAALHDKKGREEAEAFLIEGEKLVLEAAARALPVERIYMRESRAAALFPRLLSAYAAPQYADLPVYTVADACFSKISSEKAPQGVIAVLKYLDFFKRTAIIYDVDILSLRSSRIALLCGVQDPGNLGAIIRSAVAFGCEVLILTGDCADLYNPKTVRAAMGSLFATRAFVTSDPVEAIGALRAAGRRVLAAELREGALPLSSVSLTERDCILIGNEGHGIPPAASAACDASVYLPISTGAESLNAAVAASIFFWEQGKISR